VSGEIHTIFAGYTSLIEPLSLDEAYLDVTENLRGISTASATASEIRARIFEKTGLTASASISYNKFLAKRASDHRKPNGEFVIIPAMGGPFVEILPVGRLHGVGPVIADRMNRLGILTGADLIASERGSFARFVEARSAKRAPVLMILLLTLERGATANFTVIGTGLTKVLLEKRQRLLTLGPLASGVTNSEGSTRKRARPAQRHQRP
jgi:hypothetical protein